MSASAGRPVSGVVRDARGAPVALARVWFRSGPGALPDVAALTDGQGRFTLSAPRAGSYEIGCSTDTLGSARAGIVVRDQGVQVEIVLPP